MLSLEAGTRTCLVGPNGGGKTSLLHALAGIGHPSGTVRIDGMYARSLGPGQRPRFCAYLPATREVAWPLTAADVAALGLADEDEPGRIDEVLAELDRKSVVKGKSGSVRVDIGGRRLIK